jgi:hypothetical protein
MVGAFVSDLAAAMSLVTGPSMIAAFGMSEGPLWLSVFGFSHKLQHLANWWRSCSDRVEAQSVFTGGCAHV